MLTKALSISLIVSTVLLIVMLHTTTPATIGPLGILFVFILMYLSVLSALTFLFFAVSKLFARLAAFFSVRRPVQSMSLTKSYYFSSVVALAPVMFIGMQSVGEVGVYDIALIIVFVIISTVYIAKRTA